MSAFQVIIAGAIAALVLVSFVHSLAGEKRLLRPMFAKRGNRVLDNKLARLVLRFAWHVTSVLWILMAIVLYSVGFSPENLTAVILISFGVGFLFIGIFDLIASRGKHIGSPILTAIGSLCLGAFYLLEIAQ